MKLLATHLKHALLAAALLLSPQLFGTAGRSVTASALQAIGVNQTCIDCTAHKATLEKLFGLAGANDIEVARLLQALQQHPDVMDAAAVKSVVLRVLDRVGQADLRQAAQRTLELCDTANTRATRTTEPAEYVVPATGILPNVTRAPANQWAVRKSASEKQVTFDTSDSWVPVGGIMINQDLSHGGTVTFNSVASTGAALTLDAAASNVINIGNTNATAVNIATAGTAATGVSIGTAANVATIDMGTGAGITGITIGNGTSTGASNTTVLGKTTARLDAATVNVGNTLAAAINVGQDALAKTTTIHGATLNIGTGTTEVSAITIGGTTATFVGINSLATTVDGNPALNLGTITATTINMGTGPAIAGITIGNGSSTGASNTAVLGKTTARLDAATVNVGDTLATAVNLGTSAIATTINMGTGAGITGITIGNGTSTAASNTAVLGKTTARLDAATVNVGNTLATTAVNIGNTSTTATGITGITTTVDGNTTLNLGTGTATAINIGNATAATTVGITAGASGAITHTGLTEILAGNEIQFFAPTGGLHAGIKAGAIVTVSPATLILPLADGSAGQVLTTAGASGALSWTTIGIPANTSMVDAHRNGSNQTTGATTEVVQFNLADINPGTAYNTGTYTYTVPTTGKYWVNAQVCVQPVDTGTKQLDLAVGGAAQTGYQSYIVVPTLTSSGDSPTIYDTRMINLGCLKSFTAGNLVTITYTGTVGDIILQNASHFSAYLMST